MRMKRTAKAGAVVLAFALTAAACGSSHRAGGPVTGADTAGSKSPSAAAATFGTLASPCGAGTARGATGQGVTDTAITIGYGDDRGFTPAPGLDQEVGDAVQAMIKWC